MMSYKLWVMSYKLWVIMNTVSRSDNANFMDLRRFNFVTETQQHDCMGRIRPRNDGHATPRRGNISITACKRSAAYGSVEGYVEGYVESNSDAYGIN
jgi:hypothetical protein